MTKDNMTEEERANSDRLDSYKEDKKKVHIILKRTDNEGNNIFMNGYVLRNIGKIWVIAEDVLGEIRISISEIAPHGIYLHNDEKRGDRK